MKKIKKQKNSVFKALVTIFLLSGSLSAYAAPECNLKLLVQTKLYYLNQPQVTSGSDGRYQVIQSENSFCKCVHNTDSASRNRAIEIFDLLSNEDLVGFDREISCLKHPGLLKRVEDAKQNMEQKFLDILGMQKMSPREKFEVMYADVHEDIHDNTLKPMPAPFIDYPVDPSIRHFSGHSFPVNHFALTFDDGPYWNKTQKKIIAALQKEEVPATFFMLGESIEKLLKRKLKTDPFKIILKTGSNIGNHGYKHYNSRKLSNASFKKNVDKATKIIEKASALPFTGLYRFPYGSYHTRHLRILQKMNATSIFWTIDTLDWKIRKPWTLYKRVIRLLRRYKRGIILFHDIHWQTSVILPHVLKYLKKRNAVVLRLVRDQKPAPKKTSNNK